MSSLWGKLRCPCSNHTAVYTRMHAFATRLASACPCCPSFVCFGSELDCLVVVPKRQTSLISFFCAILPSFPPVCRLSLATALPHHTVPHHTCVKASVPYMEMLETWIYHGDLNDQYGEVGVLMIVAVCGGVLCRFVVAPWWRSLSVLGF